MAVLQCVCTWLILQLCGILARLVPSETQFRAQNAEPRFRSPAIPAARLLLRERVARLPLTQDRGLSPQFAQRISGIFPSLAL